MKVVTVVGARPNFIKMAPLSRELRKHFKEVIVHTGQHYDIEMSDVFFKELNIPKPDYNLEVGSGSHTEHLAKVLERLEKVLLKEKPDFAIVYGDINSTLAGALCAAKLKIPVVHVEAGMRSYNKIPEEINRVAVDHISDVFFCATKAAVENLKKEGITKNVFLAGDLMIDALVENIKIAEKKSKVLSKLGIKKKGYILATIHREENTNDRQRLKRIINALAKSKEKVILPLHPRTKKFIKNYSLSKEIANAKIEVIAPASYLDMLMLEKNAKKIVTDSGGVQKEAYFFNVPCITLRDITEWAETVENGFNILVGNDANKISDAVKNFEIRKECMFLYGKGDAGSKITDALVKLKLN